jgi:hypothetical protein
METVEVPNETTATEADDIAEEVNEIHVSHFRNSDAHSALVRFGVPLWTVATLVLLINSDIGSGVSADYILRGEEKIIEQDSLFVASIFSSVKELWINDSYPLAILIAVTSIAWPYIKLLLTFYAWFAPYKNPRGREWLVEVLDACGKWSFVDIIVLVEIMVAFRYALFSFSLFVYCIFLKVYRVPTQHFLCLLCLLACLLLLHRQTIVVAPRGTIEMRLINLLLPIRF